MKPPMDQALIGFLNGRISGRFTTRANAIVVPRLAPKKKLADRSGIIASITTPLGFYVLALLIVEGTLSIVLTRSNLSEAHVWAGFQVMLWLFGAVVVIVTLLTLSFPKNLLYGKEEHAHPQSEPSALRDQIEDLTVANVKPESLKSPHGPVA